MNSRFSVVTVVALCSLIGSPLLASGLPKESVQALIKALQDSSVEVRVAAAQSLGEFEDSSAVKPLENALIASSDAGEQTALVHALEFQDDKNTFKRLTDALSNPQFTWGTGAKAKAVEVLGAIGERKAIKELTILASGEQDAPVKAAAIKALGAIGAPPKKEEKK